MHAHVDPCLSTNQLNSADSFHRQPQNRQSPKSVDLQVPLPLRKCLLSFVCVDFCSLISRTVHVTFDLHANRSRQSRLSTFISYSCLPLHLWFAFIGSRYKIVFNISESLLFITKEVIGSFPYNYFYASVELAIESKVMHQSKETPNPRPPSPP